MSFNATRCYNTPSRKKLVSLAEFYYRKSKPSCGDCIKLTEKKGKKPDCIKCGWVELLPENFEAMELINRYANSYVDMNGNVDLKSVLATIEIENISDRYTTLQKVLLFMKTALKTSKE